MVANCGVVEVDGIESFLGGAMVFCGDDRVASSGAGFESGGALAEVAGNAKSQVTG
jgi:hypothetical protein